MPIRLAGLAFRATSPHYSDLHKTAAMSRFYPWRFDSHGNGADNFAPRAARRFTHRP
jgi:hypothetical protein